MSLPVPKLDDRGFDDLVAEAKRRIVRNCPQWTDFNASDPGMTLVELMAWMTETILYRVNRVPERNYIKFLELMGIRLKSAEPARAWVKFTVTNPPKDPVVRPGTRLSTVRQANQEPVDFETAAPLYLTTTQLIEARSQVAERSELLHGIGGPAALRAPEAGETATENGQPAFSAQTEMPHILYLRDSRLNFGDAHLAAVLQLDLELKLSTGLAGPVDVEWERWDSAAWVAVRPKEDTTDGLRQSGRIVFEELPNEDVTPALVRVLTADEFTKVKPTNGRQFALRARLVAAFKLWEEPVSDDRSDAHRDVVVPTFTSLQRRLELNPEYDLVPDRIIHETPPPADPAKPYVRWRELPNNDFAPFGTEPREGDTLYLSSPAFVRPEANVTITVKTPETLSATNALVPKLVWEYSGARGWTTLPLSQPVLGGEQDNGARALMGGGQIRFTVPVDAAIATLEGKGDVGPYIRVRMASSIYGTDAGSGRAPRVEALSIAFADKLDDWQQYLAENYLSHNDHTKQFVNHDPVQPFVIQHDRHPSLHLGFSAALPNELQRLYVVLTIPSGRRDVPLRWEYRQRDDWAPLDVIDDTRSFSRSGSIEFIGPAHWDVSQQFGRSAHWLRCRTVLADVRPNAVLKDVHLNTVEVVQARSFRDEILGSSTGEPLQTFRLIWTPVLPCSEILVREKETYDPTELEGLRKALGINAVLADTKGDWWIRWRQVESFYESRPTDRHFILEPRDGVVTFGDGKRGMIPPPGRNNVKANVYQQTAGARGNVGAQTITVLEGAIDGVGKVYNVEGAGGGADPETIEEAKLRGPYALKARDRAVTAEDFEYLAKDASIQVAKARCTVRAAAAGREEGYEKVIVVIIPQSTDDKPRPDGQLIRRVQQHLDDHRLITARVRVIGPQYEDVRLYVDVRPHPHYVGRFPDLKLAIEQRLRAFLNPLPAPGRGPDDEGWPMGRTLHKSELYYIVEQVPGVDYVDKLLIWKWEPDKSPAENLKLNESESQDNIYVDTCAFHYFREIQINQV